MQRFFDRHLAQYAEIANEPADDARSGLSPYLHFGHISSYDYLRMLWGEKILEWTASPRNALEIMIELNNRFALDGRNPNSYAGIFWVLGRYDRAWGPERPYFGTVRYMSSERTQKKLNVERYLRAYGTT